MASGRAAAASAACLLLLCCCAGATSARTSPAGLRLKTDNSDNNVNALAWLTRRGRGGENEPAYIALKYKVPPSMHDKFMDEWGRVEKTLRKARGVDFYQLTKTTTDNLYFWSYSEWDTFRDLMDHFDSRDVKDFADFLEDNDIMVEFFPLEAVGDTKREYRADREGPATAAAQRAAAAKDLERRSRSREGAEWDPRDAPAHVAIQFHVPPSERRDFIDAFMDIQDRVVKDDDENRFYTLRKFATMNHHYVLRGGWDSLDGYLDHFVGKTGSRLKEFAADNDIEWFADPFRVIFSSEEEDMEWKRNAVAGTKR